MSGLRKCPDCGGAGSHVVNYRSGNPEAETDETCGTCAGVGSLYPDHPGYATAPRWRPERLDPLLGMAQNRRHYLIQRRTPWGADKHPYVFRRREAMVAADLPPDDVHLLVSPETAAFFNQLTRDRRTGAKP